MSNDLIKFEDSDLSLLKDMFFKGCSDGEFKMFVYACQRTGLDPFMKQIHPVKRYDSKLKKEIMTVQTSIDGYRLIAERTGRYAPGQEPTFSYDDKGVMISATAYVKKQTSDGTWHIIAATAFFEEYCQKTQDGRPVFMWAKMPKNQTAKCAESLALRKAFPAEMSGIYTKEEMEQSETIEADVKPVDKESEITSEQAEELAEIMAGCETEYISSVWKHLAKVNITKFEDLTLELYEKIKKAAQIKAKEYKDKLDADTAIAAHQKEKEEEFKQDLFEEE